MMRCANRSYNWTDCVAVPLLKPAPFLHPSSVTCDKCRHESPPLNGGAHAADWGSVIDRVMDCAGSETNTGNFVFAQRDINAVKGQVSCLPFQCTYCRRS